MQLDDVITGYPMKCSLTSEHLPNICCVIKNTTMVLIFVKLETCSLLSNDLPMMTKYTAGVSNFVVLGCETCFLSWMQSTLLEEEDLKVYFRRPVKYILSLNCDIQYVLSG